MAEERRTPLKLPRQVHQWQALRDSGSRGRQRRSQALEAFAFRFTPDQQQVERG